MFKRISYTIALQFTAFVFLLLLFNGAIFLAADFNHARREMGMRLARSAEFVMEQTKVGPQGIAVSLPPMMHNRVRITDPEGKPVYSGAFFEELPFESHIGLSSKMLDGDRYSVLTSGIDRGGERIGFMQIAEVDRHPFAELKPRTHLYLLVSAAISALTFGVGLFFARRSLKPAEQMVARLEQFTQDASHELRTPLATLNSSLDLALKSGKYREGIVSAKEDVQQIAALTERLLELARLDASLIQKHDVDLSALVQDSLDRHQLVAKERGVTLAGDITPAVKTLGDAFLLPQVLGNLLTNAIKFSKPGGTVRVQLKDRSLTVADDGIGIAKDALPHIFDRFFRADTSRTAGGYGLGLALVKRIVDLHGWSINVRSVEGKGTQFTLRGW
ncbi:MAG: HAMP domain-containing sensor histidine kinase [Candidatus Peregrinibacteria bacterium]|nr:HAMP domain-containing sensor histidine kinase [Candidatus Peregrinibacteria bacterium]